MVNTKTIKDAISKVKHPAIDNSLTALGMVQDIELYTENVVILTFVFPFVNIPIADKLIDSVKKVVEKQGLDMQYIVRTMKRDEKKRFLIMEKEGWIGNDVQKNVCQH